MQLVFRHQIQIQLLSFSKYSCCQSACCPHHTLKLLLTLQSWLYFTALIMETWLWIMHHWLDRPSVWLSQASWSDTRQTSHNWQVCHCHLQVVMVVVVVVVQICYLYFSIQGSIIHFFFLFFLMAFRYCSSFPLIGQDLNELEFLMHYFPGQLLDSSWESELHGCWLW